MYHAVVIEESLGNKEVLKDFKILETKIGEDWKLDILEIPDVDDAIAKIQPAMVKDQPYYFHIFDEGKTLVIVFRQKVFRVDPNDISTWSEVAEYGSKELNIPIDQLDFYPTKISDEPEWLAGRD